MARPSQPWYRESKGTWYCSMDGKKVSLGVRGEGNRTEAMKAWHGLMANGKAKPEPKAEAPSVAEVISAFLTDAEGRLKPATVRGYRDFLTPFVKAHGTLKADKVTAALASAYSRQAEWSNSTRHGFLSALSIALKWGGFPIVGLKKPPMDSRGDKALVSQDAHAKLMEAAPDNFKPFLMLLYLAGARPSEVSAITADNFDEAGGMVRLKEHKTAHQDGKPSLDGANPVHKATPNPFKADLSGLAYVSF